MIADIPSSTKFEGKLTATFSTSGQGSGRAALKCNLQTTEKLSKLKYSNQSTQAEELATVNISHQNAVIQSWLDDNKAAIVNQKLTIPNLPFTWPRDILEMDMVKWRHQH
eukprot:13980402-Ditylum_brightwellii.AAC.1